jgi:hypothetical protein
MSHKEDHNKYITNEEAVGHALKSIAAIEAGLSEVVNIGAREISFCNGLHDYGNSSLSQIIELNSSINTLLKSIIQLQMLLFIKLKNIVNTYIKEAKKVSFASSVPEALPIVPLPVVSFNHDSLDQSPEISSEPATDEIKPYLLHGKVLGISSEASDHFHGGVSVIQVYVNNIPEERGNYLYYSVKMGPEVLLVTAPLASSEIRMNYDSETITLEGISIIKYTVNSGNEIKDVVISTDNPL